MSNKEKVRAVHPNAAHKRYSTTGYTTVWTDRFRGGSRLSEGKTTAQAWKNAWINIQEKIRT